MLDPFRQTKDAERKKNLGKCVTFRCTNRAKKHTGGGFESYCSTCRSTIHRARHPMQYHYNLLRCGANRRKIAFELTFEEYEKFCLETGYHDQRGKQPHSLTIDRKDATLGYSYDNIRVLTHAENSARQDKPWFTGYFGYYVPSTKYRETCEVTPDPEKCGDDEGAGHEDGPDLPFEANADDPF